MKNFKYELYTETVGSSITQTMYFFSDMDDDKTRELMYVNVMQTQDVSQKEALEKLGWTCSSFKQLSSLDKFINFFTKRFSKLPKLKD